MGTEKAYRDSWKKKITYGGGVGWDENNTYLSVWHFNNSSSFCEWSTEMIQENILEFQNTSKRSSGK